MLACYAVTDAACGVPSRVSALRITEGVLLGGLHSQTTRRCSPTFATKSPTRGVTPLAVPACRRAHSGQKVGLRHAQMLRILRVAPVPASPLLTSAARVGPP